MQENKRVEYILSRMEVLGFQYVVKVYQNMIQSELCSDTQRINGNDLFVTNWYYSQIAAFQAKTDYGFDLGDSLAEQAVGELQYEIDTEVINLLDETAGAVQPDLTWSKTLPVGVEARVA